MPVHKWALMQSPFPVISKPLCYLSMYSNIHFIKSIILAVFYIIKLIKNDIPVRILSKSLPCS